jgi:uncharacterized protein YgiM (DUF1202 family)
MKTKLCSILIAMISTALAAQQMSNAPAAAPIEAPASPASPAVTAAASTNVPAKPAKKKAAKKPVAKKPPSVAPETVTVPLVAGPAVVSANHVNVRGRARINSEVITRMTNGEPVMVLEEITLKNSGPEEPSAWAKIVLPEKAHAWVKSSYLDADKSVKPQKLNLRGGPGENYSVLGVLRKGEVVKEISTKGDWSEIEATTNAYAFMAAQYLKQEPATAPTVPATSIASAAPTATAVPPPTPTPVSETAPVASPAAEAPVLAANATPAPPAPIPAPAATNELTSISPAATNVVSEEPPIARIVEREGYVRGTFSIQAPTRFELVSEDTHKTINYLYTTSTNLDLSRYKGLHIIVTGEESLDDRWKNTPVITIQRIQVLD